MHAGLVLFGRANGIHGRCGGGATVTVNMEERKRHIVNLYI